jgi:RNA polymerase sigma-70 factor (ECF subfamily)
MARIRLSEEAAPEARFEALYAKHYRQVLGYVLRRAPAEVAADVVAEVFLVAWRRLGDVPNEPVPWLLGVARKCLANERRGGRRRAALVDVLKATGYRHHETEVPYTDRLQTLAEAILRLSETDRELLRLVAWDGLTAGEAAAALGISHAAVRVRLHRARRRLARELGQQSLPQTTLASGSGEHLKVRQEIR